MESKKPVYEIKIRELDLIDDVVRPGEGSIREVRIDGILDKKAIWNGVKWISCCRYHKCKEFSVIINGLCKKHYSEQVNTNIEGEIKKRGDKSYKWVSKKWKMLCDIHMCKEPVANIKIGKCAAHIKNPDVPYSGTQHTINIFHQLREEMEVERKKELIKQRKVKREKKKEEKKDRKEKFWGIP